MGLWKKIERIGLEDFPFYLEDTDMCVYARDYIARGGYSASEANKLVINFKKDVTKRGSYEWHYKIEAINQFARELAELLPDGGVVTCVPSSRSKDDPEYDSRLEDTLEALKTIKPSINLIYPITAKTSGLPAHYGGPRDPTTIYNNLTWEGLPIRTRKIIIIDDVITSGAHFKACQKLILEHCAEIEIIGVFWAKTIWPKNNHF